MSGSQSLESLHNVSPIEGVYPQKSAILNENFEIRERCKGVHCVDLGESFPTSIYLQNLASIQPRTSRSKFGSQITLLITYRASCSQKLNISLVSESRISSGGGGTATEKSRRSRGTGSTKQWKYSLLPSLSLFSYAE